MRANRLFPWTFAIALLGAMSSAAVAEEQDTVQKLLERGALDEAVARADENRDDSEATYLAAQALIKMENRDAAGERYARLKDAGDDSWKAIGESGAELLAGNADAAMAAATRAVEANEGNPYAHYQQGLVASRQNNFQRAAQAFARSVELKSDFAYGNYYAGLAFQRARQAAKASVYLNQFLKLAPDAPEKAAVVAILRALR